MGEAPPGGGDCEAQGGGVGQEGGPGGISGAIQIDNALDIQSNLWMGEGFDREGVGGGAGSSTGHKHVRGGGNHGPNPGRNVSP